MFVIYWYGEPHAVRPFVLLLEEGEFYVTLLDDHFNFCYHEFIFSYEKPYN